MKAFVTGCAGFIGSNLVDRLLDLGHEVVGVDNLSTGRLEFLGEANRNPNFKFFRMDLLDKSTLSHAMQECDIVFHLSANADVRHGLEHPFKDIEQNIIATSNVLEAMIDNDVTEIVFSSTGSVYGNTGAFPTPEDVSMPLQTSLYGSSKLSAEGLIQAYSEGYGMQAYIFRFSSILGPRYSHGICYDLFKKLKKNHERLPVLGNGKLVKTYLHVHDCIDAIVLGLEMAEEQINIFNLATNETVSVEEMVRTICAWMHFEPEIVFASRDTKQGWVGDEKVFLDINKAKYFLGWTPRYTVKEGVWDALQYLEENPWLWEEE